MDRACHYYIVMFTNNYILYIYARFYILCSIFYILSTIYYILYTIYCILYTIYYILYTIYCILYTIYYILHTIYYILYTIYYILYTIYYILYTIHYLLYILYCTLYIHFILYILPDILQNCCVLMSRLTPLGALATGEAGDDPVEGEALEFAAIRRKERTKVRAPRIGFRV